MERIEPTLGDDIAPRRDYAERMPARSRMPIGAVIVFLMAVAAAAAYFLWPREAPPPPVAAAVATTPPLPKVELQGPKHPVGVEPSHPLPALTESDGPMAAALSALIGLDAFGRLFVPENLVRNIVAAIDNLPRDVVSQRVNPLRSVAGLPTTTGKDATLTLAPTNASRYAAPMRVMDAASTEKVVALYRRHYPLFQQAYVELGYPNGYFNDRLVEVIDHLLETPDPAGPLLLKQPKVLYEFADPSLEERSAGQKMLLRIGKDNREKVKAKLREIRAQLSSRTPQG